jgi:hypothetical protein
VHSHILQIRLAAPFSTTNLTLSQYRTSWAAVNVHNGAFSRSRTINLTYIRQEHVRGTRFRASHTHQSSDFGTTNRTILDRHMNRTINLTVRSSYTL